jgi:hypothetical protein
VTPADWELREPTAFRLPVRRNRYGGSSAGDARGHVLGTVTRHGGGQAGACA